MNWRDDFGVLAAFYGFSLLLVVLLGDETLYDRGHPKPKPSGIGGRLALLTGLTGVQATGRPSLVSVSKRILRLGIRPEVFTVSEYHLACVPLLCHR